MRILHFIITFLFLFAIQVPSLSQSYHNKLKQGEKVPDVSFTVLEDGKTRIGRISDYKGKLLILDYWHKWCGSCIAAFPKLAALQKKYREKIVILPISFIHTTKEVIEFAEDRKKLGQEIKLPLAIMPTIENALFKALPTVGYPYDVWIDMEGHFIAASSAVDVTEQSIEAALKNADIGFKTKNYQMDFDASKPFLINNNGGADSVFVYRSLITEGVDSVSRYQSVSFDSNRVHIFYGQKTAIELIKYSLKEGISSDAYSKYVIVDEGLKGRLKPDGIYNSRAWQQRNKYCYDLVLPGYFSRKEAFAIMHQDIDRFFRVQSSFEERLMDCYVLRRGEGGPDPTSNSTTQVYKVQQDTVIIRNRLPTFLLGEIGNSSAPILLDETGLQAGIDATFIKTPVFDAEFYNAQLRKYGLELLAAKRVLRVIAIRGYQ